MYCDKGWSGGNTISRNSVGDEGGEWGAQPKGVFANNSIDLYKGLDLNEYLVKAKPVCTAVPRLPHRPAPRRLRLCITCVTYTLHA